MIMTYIYFARVFHYVLALLSGAERWRSFHFDKKKLRWIFVQCQDVRLKSPRSTMWMYLSIFNIAAVFRLMWMYWWGLYHFRADILSPTGVSEDAVGRYDSVGQSGGWCGGGRCGRWNRLPRLYSFQWLEKPFKGIIYRHNFIRQPLFCRIPTIHV